MSNLKDIRVLVGMPSGQHIPILTTKSLLEYQTERKYPSQIRFKIDTYIEKARNELVYQAADAGASHIMFIDSDMVFPAHAVDLLVEREKDIIGGLYFGRLHPKPMAFRIKDKETVSVDPNTETGIIEVDMVGAGFLLINMNVFKKLDPPFFTFSYEHRKYNLPESNFIPIGEDAYFCLNAKRAGFKIHVDTTFELGHVGTHTYRKADWEVWKENPQLYERL